MLKILLLSDVRCPVCDLLQFAKIMEMPLFPDLRAPESAVVASSQAGPVEIRSLVANRPTRTQLGVKSLQNRWQWV